MGNCTTPDLGRIKKVGLFLADECLTPLYGADMGYLDDCPAAFETSDNVDDGEEFTRRCADGSIKRYIPGVKSLQSIEVNVDLHWLDPEWISNAGGATAIEHNSEVIGWADGKADRFNVVVIVWQEILGECGGGVTGDFVRIYPVKGATVSEEGTPGSEDNYVRITGSTSDSHNIGFGPIPLALDTTTGDTEWLSDELADATHRFRFVGGIAPDGCGAMATTDPGSA
ncbi:MAG TPA: hypothetical protein VIL10_01380 [Marmoricola sp.]